MLTSRGRVVAVPREPRRAGACSSSASPPKITYAQRQRPAPLRAASSPAMQLAERRRRLVQHRHPLARQQLVERSGRAASPSTAPPPAGRRRAARPTSPTPRSRTRTSGTASTRRPAPKPNQRSRRLEQPRHVAVRDQHPLRLPGRARGVDHVGQVVRPRPARRVVAIGAGGQLGGVQRRPPSPGRGGSAARQRAPA